MRGKGGREEKGGIGIRCWSEDVVGALSIYYNMSWWAYLIHYPSSILIFFCTILLISCVCASVVLVVHMPV